MQLHALWRLAEKKGRGFEQNSLAANAGIQGFVKSPNLTISVLCIPTLTDSLSEKSCTLILRFRFQVLRLPFREEKNMHH